jgi:hypothetical protein
MSVRRMPARAPPQSLFSRLKDFVKQNQLISKGLTSLSGMSGLQKYSIPLTLASKLASHYGYGKKKKRVVRKRKVRRVVRKRRVARRK